LIVNNDADSCLLVTIYVAQNEGAEMI